MGCFIAGHNQEVPGNRRSRAVCFSLFFFIMLIPGQYLPVPTVAPEVPLNVFLPSNFELLSSAAPGCELDKTSVLTSHQIASTAVQASLQAFMSK